MASNLSSHPAIKRLPMNDFTDDSAVKFYLNRRRVRGEDTEDDDEEVMGEMIDEESGLGDEEDNGITDATSGEISASTSTSSRTHLTVNVSGSAPLERFSSPSFRFALQLVIYPDELPDDMMFDPQTEAIVFKHTMKDRSMTASTGVSQTQRKKVFVFPKNITVAEVIELGLERFGILDGVVDGGDEVEDKMTKRRSSSRVRYALHISVDSQGTFITFFSYHIRKFLWFVVPRKSENYPRAVKSPTLSLTHQHTVVKASLNVVPLTLLNFLGLSTTFIQTTRFSFYDALSRIVLPHHHAIDFQHLLTKLHFHNYIVNLHRIRVCCRI